MHRVQREVKVEDLELDEAASVKLIITLKYEEEAAEFRLIKKFQRWNEAEESTIEKLRVILKGCDIRKRMTLNSE